MRADGAALPLAQESLTDDLADMAAALKSRTLAVEGKVRERGELLEGTEAALDKSLHDTRRSAAQATQIHKRWVWGGEGGRGREVSVPWG